MLNFRNKTKSEIEYPKSEIRGLHHTFTKILIFAVGNEQESRFLYTGL